MFIGLLQLRYSILEDARLYLFSIFVLLTWLIWVAKIVLSRRYRPWTEPHTTTTSVVVPVVDEPLDLFRDVLARIVEQQPTQILVVINGPQNPDLERVCEEFAPYVEHTWTPIPGKRNAVRVGVERSVGDVVLLVDSDTIWTDGTLEELVKPFRDPRVGGVTTRQRILEPERSFLTRWADWLENSRVLYSQPAQSVLGSIGCLPGRTIAFRRHILVKAMPQFMTQKFLGVFLEVSDDRTLTNLTLKQGYRTVYQSTSLVYTDAPTKLKKLVKQQFRWARGSQYNTLRMLPWMIRHTPVLAFFFLSDIVLPFLWLCSAVAWGVRMATDSGANLYADFLDTGRAYPVVAIVVMTVILSTLSMCIRQHRHLKEVQHDVLRMPLFILFSTLVLMPIRIWGFIRLAHAGGWGTRANAYSGSADDAAAVLAAGQEGGTDEVRVVPMPVPVSRIPVPAAELAIPSARRAERPVPVLVGAGARPELTLAPGAEHVRRTADVERLRTGVWESAERVVATRAPSPAVTATAARSRAAHRVARRRFPNVRVAIPYVLAIAALVGGILYDIQPA